MPFADAIMARGLEGRLSRAASEARPHRRVDILGVRVSDVTYDEAVAIIKERIAARQPTPVVTPNTEFVVAAQSDRAFRAVINEAALSIPDGIGLILASRLLGQPLREHVRGTDLVERLAALAAAEGLRLFLLGAAEGVAEQAAARLVERHPGLRIVGTHAGVPDPAYDGTARAAVAASGRVDILLVAYGAPSQEKWIARNLPQLDVPVAIGVGGVFDFISGRAKRAPVWVRRVELEWLYRLIRQPWRWQRQLALPRFALLVLAERLRHRRGEALGDRP